MSLGTGWWAGNLCAPGSVVLCKRVCVLPGSPSEQKLGQKEQPITRWKWLNCSAEQPDKGQPAAGGVRRAPVKGDCSRTPPPSSVLLFLLMAAEMTFSLLTRG